MKLLSQQRKADPMIIPCFVFNSVEEYQSDIDVFRYEKPGNCKACGARSSFWGHGSFKRSVLQEGAKVQVQIQRFLCHACGKTVSLLYSFLVAYRSHSAATIEAAVEMYSKEYVSYRKLAAELSKLDTDEPPSPAHSSVFQWVKMMTSKAAPLAVQAQKELLLRGRINDVEGKQSCGSPNALKSRNEKKQVDLHALAEFISLGGLLVCGNKHVPAKLHAFFLKNVETIQMMLCGHLLRLSAPQSLKH